MNALVVDSEWHSFFLCPCNIEPRALFVDAFPRFYKYFFHISDDSEPPPFEPLVVSMAKIFHEARFNRYLTNELARFVTGIHVCRRRAFSSMSKDGPLSPLSAALDRLGDEPVQ